MTYPLDQLVIIGPILFIVLMVAFPVIGVFGGWKRAAYWGGGNFLFYIIGLIIWRYTSGGIVNLFLPLLQQLTQQADFSKIAIAIAAPAYFLIVMIVANLFLLINYYAWFKRVAGLKKVKTVKKTDRKGNVIKTKVAVEHNYSTGYKVMSHVVGGVGMGALMLPSTFAFTQAVMYTTTSVTTRKNSSLASSIYDMLFDVNDKMSWLSYYSSDTAKDYDALFAGLAMREKKINIQLPGHSEEEPMTVIDAVSGTFSEGIGQIYDSITGQGEMKDLNTSVDELKESWNTIVEQAGDEMSALFNSEDATDVMQGLLEIPDEYKGDLNETQVQQFIDNKEVIAGFAEGFKKVNISEGSYDNMVNSLKDMYNLPADLDETQAKQFNETLDTLMKLLFNVQK
ncbi:MAG: hypothetical protein ACOQNV_02245 [Mycoplasmoidaceae bacterium]